MKSLTFAGRKHFARISKIMMRETRSVSDQQCKCILCPIVKVYKYTNAYFKIAARSKIVMNSSAIFRQIRSP